MEGIGQRAGSGREKDSGIGKVTVIAPVDLRKFPIGAVIAALLQCLAVSEGIIPQAL